MASQSVNIKPTANNNPDVSGFNRYLPFMSWLVHYDRKYLSGDLIAGVIVAVMLIPQGMAYALLAGLPPEIGLYASIVPLLLYGLLGTSRTLAVGPVAVVSIIVASGISNLNPASTADYIAMALILALLVGIIQLAMGIFRVGFLVNFLSHPVLSGFTSAAALVIGFSQLKHLLGFNIPRSEQVHELIIYAAEHFSKTNYTVLAIGAASIAVLLYFKFGISNHLEKIGVPKTWIVSISKLGPLFIVIVGTLVVFGLDLENQAGVPIVGDVPSGLPLIAAPNFDMELWQQLLPIAFTISVVSYMESISVAKSLASKRREKVDANQELIALGVANIGSAFSSGYPVTGGFSRSIVNFTAGANTGLASMITAVLIALTVLFFTPLFYYLPKAILAAIIVVAVSSLLDFKTLRHAWNYDKADAAALVITFGAVLLIGIENGIIVGAGASLVLYLWRTSRPHIAVVGRIGDSEEYRNILRHETSTPSNILALRVDENLYFPNVQYLENVVLCSIADKPELEHFVLVCSAVNYIDTSALEVLESLAHALKENKISFNLAAVKGPVMDRLQKVGFVDEIGADRFYFNTHMAMEAIQAAEA